MDINTRSKGEVVVLDIAGEIDLYNAPEIKDIINKLIEEKKYAELKKTRKQIKVLKNKLRKAVV